MKRINEYDTVESWLYDFFAETNGLGIVLIAMLAILVPMALGVSILWLVLKVFG